MTRKEKKIICKKIFFAYGKSFLSMKCLNAVLNCIRGEEGGGESI